MLSEIGVDSEGSDGFPCFRVLVYKCFTSNRVAIGCSNAILLDLGWGGRLGV